MMSRTHGQPASPTTLGKELANYRRRMRVSRDHFVDVQILGKLMEQLETLMHTLLQTQKKIGLIFRDHLSKRIWASS